jgi:hypothetical protein
MKLKVNPTTGRLDLILGTENFVALNDSTAEVREVNGAPYIRIPKITVSETEPSDPQLYDLWVAIL